MVVVSLYHIIILASRKELIRLLPDIKISQMHGVAKFLGISKKPLLIVHLCGKKVLGLMEG
jgi:hypothetical protein